MTATITPEEMMSDRTRAAAVELFRALAEDGEEGLTTYTITIGNYEVRAQGDGPMANERPEREGTEWAYAPREIEGIRFEFIARAAK